MWGLYDDGMLCENDSVLIYSISVFGMRIPILKRLGPSIRKRAARWIWPHGNPQKQFPADMDKDFKPLYELCGFATLTSTERLYALYKSVEYIVRHKIPGDFVECGVWRGGSVMMMALALQHFGDTTRKLCCFDTFEGMPAPTAADIHRDGTPAEAMLVDTAKTVEHGANIWAISPLEAVKKNVESTGYPAANISYIKGKVEDTLPGRAPESIALLRLDTDWYASTKHELIHLYPQLTNGGVLIIDDYGVWRGCRQAADEYFSRLPVLLHRIDQDARITVKGSVATFAKKA
jgi:O-methyltransferase